MKHIALLLTLCLFPGLLSAQTAAPPDKKPIPAESAIADVHTTDDVDIIRETQLGIDIRDYTGLVWWIPFEFWVRSAAKDGTPAEKARERLKALKDFTIVGVFVGKVSALASFEFVTPSDLQKNTFLRDSEGQDYPAFSELTGDAKNLADVMKPILSNALGHAGENFAMLFFPARNKTGKRIADEMSKGSFSVVFKSLIGEPEAVFLWRTPLTSVSAPRYCPVGKERVHADWDYCPRHGVKLDQNP